MVISKPKAPKSPPPCDELDPDDGHDPRIPLRKNTRRVTKRKGLQLCAQVRETLEYALSWESGDPVLQQLTIESVMPAPNPSRLLVTVLAQEPITRTQTMEHLSRAVGWLRNAVAIDIHRKRVPELAFHVTLMRKP